MKNRLTLLLLLLISLSATAQTPPVNTSFNLKGILQDSITNEGEPYATIRIVKKETPDTPVKLAVTDTKGRFNEKVNGQGNFIITISSIGKTTAQKEFTVTAEDKIIDLGTLYTQEATNELASLEVVAQKPLVKVDVDKIEYNIEDDPDSKTNNVLEMLRKVPLVTVDGEDNIQVNGSSSFKVHVNGKPNNMMTDNPKDVLKSMPASTIKYIEVITNPGAKYDAEGIGGILNIVTIGSGFEGYTATVSANANNMGGGGSVYATVKQNKFTVTGNYSANYYNEPTNTGETYREAYNSETHKYLSTTYNTDYKGLYQNGNVEASYEVDTLRLFTFAVGMYGGNYDNDGVNYTEMLDAQRAPTYSYRTITSGNNGWYSVRANADYQRSFRTKERLLTFSYKVNTQPNTNKYNNRYEELDNIFLPAQNSTGKSNTLEHTFQGDYTTPLGKYHTIETGVKYIIRNNTSDNKYYLQEEAGGNNIYNEDKSSNYKHLNDILGVYAGYTLRYKSFSFKPGLRYEYTMQNVKYVLGPGNDFKVKYNDVVPSVTLGTKVGKTQNIRGGYNMRIWRPGIYQLNPYIDDRDPNNIYYGNPNLETEKSHNFNVSYSTFSSKFNFNGTLRHSFNNNSIQRYTFLKEEVSHTTYGNIGKTRSTGGSIYANWNASPKTRIYMNGSTDYQEIKSDEESNYGWRASLFGGAQHTFPAKIRVSLNGGGSTPNISLQGKRSGYYYYSINVNRTFVNDRLTVSGYVSNLFNKYRSYSNTTHGKDFLQKSSSKYVSRYFGMSVSYRMGELKASVKKAARTINNDDVKSDGDSGGGGGGGGK